MTKLSLNRVYTLQDCVLLQETLREQKNSLLIKIGFLERRIVRYREIIEQTTGELHVKQTVLDNYEQLLSQAPSSVIKLRLRRDRAESQVLILRARLLRYSSVGLLNLENRLLIDENTVELIDAHLQQLAGCAAQLADQIVADSLSQQPDTTGQPALPDSKKKQELSTVLFSEQPFLTLKRRKQPPLPGVKNGIDLKPAPASTKPRSKSRRRPPSPRN